MENDILVIGIAGGTGSGKTTLMDNLIGKFWDEVTVLSHDNYYRRHDELTYEQRCRLNYDEPASLETELMADHLSMLRRGEAIDCARTARARSPWSTMRTASRSAWMPWSSPASTATPSAWSSCAPT